MSLKNLTREQILAETRNAAIEDRFPNFGGPEKPPAAQNPPADPSLFTVTDLWEAKAPGVAFAVPGTPKRFFVHPITSDDYELMLRWSLADEIPDPGNVGGNPRKAALDAQFLTQRMREYQVVLCCKQGEGRDAARLFQRSDASALRRMLPYAVINRICALSDELTGTDETLGAGVRGFFTRIASCLRTCVLKSGSSDASPTGWQGILGQLASLASRASTAGSWGSGLSEELERVCAEAEGLDSPATE